MTMEQQFDAATLGMWVFLLTEIMFFGGMFCAYTIYRCMYPGRFRQHQQAHGSLLWRRNTAVLICQQLDHGAGRSRRAIRATESPTDSSC